jgi:GDP-4-dehydro-6-deoxy-D-mannose reductase
LFVSSGLVYGSLPPHQEGFDEGAPLRPRGAYAWTKAAADRLAALRREEGLDIVTVRPFNHTGPGRRADFAESRLAREIAAVELGLQEPVVKAYNLAATRDFLAVDDVVEAYLRLLEPRVVAGTYNVASGHGRTIQEIWDALRVHSPAPVRLVSDPAEADPSDRSIGNARRLRAATGWVPTRDLDAALGRLLAWWREELRASSEAARG